MLTKCEGDLDMCVPVSFYCDGKPDCQHGRDEMGCSCNDWGAIETRDHHNVSHCMPERWIQQDHPVCAEQCHPNDLKSPEDHIISKGIALRF